MNVRQVEAGGRRFLELRRDGSDLPVRVIDRKPFLDLRRDQVGARAGRRGVRLDVESGDNLEGFSPMGMAFYRNGRDHTVRGRQISAASNT